MPRITKKERHAEKERFKSSLKEFTEELQAYVSAEDGEWTVKGFIDIFASSRIWV